MSPHVMKIPFIVGGLNILLFSCFMFSCFSCKVVSVTLTQRCEMGTSACTSAFVSMCYISEYTRILWNKKRVPIFFLANETAGHSRGEPSALNALRTFMMAPDSQNQNSLNVSAGYVSIKLLAS